MSVRLVCGNCGRIELLDSWEEAEAAGWDTPLTFGYTACPECPGTAVYFPLLLCQKARGLTGEEREQALEEAAKATMQAHPRFLPGPTPPGVWMPKP